MRFALLALLIAYVTYLTFGPAQSTGGEPGAESPEALLAKLEVFADDTETGPMVLARHASPKQAELTARLWGLQRLGPDIALAHAFSPEHTDALDAFDIKAQALLQRYGIDSVTASALPADLDVHAFVTDVTVMMNELVRETGAKVGAPLGLRRDELNAVRGKIEIDGDTAVAILNPGKQLWMVQIDGRWYLDLRYTSLVTRLTPRTPEPVLEPASDEHAVPHFDRDE